MEVFFAKADPSWWVDEGPYFRAHSQFWFEAIKGISCDVILDLGCGRGRFTVPLAKIGEKIIAADLNHRMLRLVKERAHTYSIVDKIDCVVCDGQYLPFKDEAFDLVNFIGTLIHIPDQQKTLNEIAHVVKREGYVAIDHTNYLSLRFFWDGMKHYTSKMMKFIAKRELRKGIFCKYCSLWSFKRMFYDEGFSLISINGFQIIPFLPVFGQFHDARFHVIPFNLAERVDKRLRGSALVRFAYNILIIGKKRNN